MSIEFVQAEINRFLYDSNHRVLVISGRWGVGKTYAWNRFLGQAARRDRIKADYYSYVSLFGVDDLADLKASIFQNTISKSDIGKNADLDTLKDMVKSAPNLWRKGGKLGRLFPGAEKYLSTFERVGFFWVKQQLVCIDDLERKGTNLDMRSVMGLISYLNEQRKCKVVLLLNDEKLDSGEEKEFRSQLEKVADITLQFSPTPTESTMIALDETKDSQKNLADHCRTLGIVNIRTIKKLEAMVARLAEELEEFDARVLQQAIRSVALFGFAKFQPSEAPSIEFIKQATGFGQGFNEALREVFAEDGNDEQAEHNQSSEAWRALLSEYDFTTMDEFDATVAAFVTNGYVDPEALSSEAKSLQDRLTTSDEDRSFEEAWALYHDSFDDNVDEVTAALASAVQNVPAAISPLNLSSTISILKELRWDGDTKELIESYIDGRKDAPNEFWDLSENPFGADVRDPDVRQAFAEKFSEFKEEHDTAQLLQKIGKTKGWQRSEIEHLASLDTAAYREIFKTLKGKDLRQALAGALAFKTIANPDDLTESIAQSVVEALKEIGSESSINRRRVSQKGIDMPAEAEDLEVPH